MVVSSNNCSNVNIYCICFLIYKCCLFTYTVIIDKYTLSFCQNIRHSIINVSYIEKEKAFKNGVLVKLIDNAVIKWDNNVKYISIQACVTLNQYWTSTSSINFKPPEDRLYIVYINKENTPNIVLYMGKTWSGSLTSQDDVGW